MTIQFKPQPILDSQFLEFGQLSRGFVDECKFFCKAYDEICKKIDINNYAKYMAAQIYYRNADWPNNNVKAWSTAIQPWKFMIFDVDHGFDYSWNPPTFYEKTMFEWIRQGGDGECANNNSPYCFHNLFVKLIQNPDFKRTFINNAMVLYNSYINSVSASYLIDKMVSMIPESEKDRDLQNFPHEGEGIRNICNIEFDYKGDCIKQWVLDRDKTVFDEFKKEFNLGDKVLFFISTKGNGQILVDGMDLPQDPYWGFFLTKNHMYLEAVPFKNAKFKNWSDGEKDNPREITIDTNAVFVAEFE